MKQAQQIEQVGEQDERDQYIEQGPKDRRHRDIGRHEPADDSRQDQENQKMNHLFPFLLRR